MRITMHLTFYCFVLFLGYGCAAKKLAIDNADSLITYQITKRLPMTGKKKDVLEKDVSKLLNAAKPDARGVKEIVKKIDIDETSEIDAHYSQLETIYRKVAKDFSHLLSHHMADFSPEEQTTFFKNLKKDNDKTPKDKKQREEEIEERVEYFLGSINDEQKKLMRNYESYFQERNLQRRERKKELQKKFKKIYQAESDKKNREWLFLEAYGDYQNESLKGNKNLEIIKKLIPTISSKQKAHFNQNKQEIVELIDYFIDVSY